MLAPSFAQLYRWRMLAAIFMLTAGTLTIPDGPILAEEIGAADDRFFTAYFGTTCQPDLIRSFLTDDFEMYHDRGGRVAANAEEFLRDYRRGCAERQPADAWRSRRELVPGTLRVDPVPGFGAIEGGEHRFYERQGDGPENLAGFAQFTQLWEKTPAGWKLKRVFSFAHRAAK